VKQGLWLMLSREMKEKKKGKEWEPMSHATFTTFGMHTAPPPLPRVDPFLGRARKCAVVPSFHWYGKLARTQRNAHARHGTEARRTEHTSTGRDDRGSGMTRVGREGGRRGGSGRAAPGVGTPAHGPRAQGTRAFTDSGAGACG
jgi:hypothetical protein